MADQEASQKMRRSRHRPKISVLAGHILPIPPAQLHPELREFRPQQRHRISTRIRLPRLVVQLLLLLLLLLLMLPLLLLLLLLDLPALLRLHRVLLQIPASEPAHLLLGMLLLIHSQWLQLRAREESLSSVQPLALKSHISLLLLLLMMRLLRLQPDLL